MSLHTHMFGHAADNCESALAIRKTQAFIGNFKTTLFPQVGELESFSRINDAREIDREGVVRGVSRDRVHHENALVVENIAPSLNGKNAWVELGDALNSTQFGTQGGHGMRWQHTVVDGFAVVYEPGFNAIGDVTTQQLEIKLHEPLASGVTVTATSLDGSTSVILADDTTPTGIWISPAFDEGVTAAIAGSLSYAVLATAVGDLVDIEFKNLQIENVLHAIDQSAGPYVSVGVPTGAELYPTPDDLQAADWSNYSSDRYAFVNGNIEFNVSANGESYAGVVPSTAKVADASVNVIVVEVTDWIDTGTTGKLIVYGGYNGETVLITGNGRYATTLRADNTGSGTQPTLWLGITAGSSLGDVSGTITYYSAKATNPASQIDGLELFTSDKQGVAIPEAVLKGVIFWDDRVNQVYQSESLDDGAWTSTGSPTPESNGFIAGLPSWDILCGGTADVEHGIYTQGLATTLAFDSYTTSFFVAKGVARYVWVAFDTLIGVKGVQFFDLEGSGAVAGTLEPSDITVSYGEIEPVKGGFLCTGGFINADKTAAITTIGFSDVDTATNDVFPSQALLGAVTGVQLEKGVGRTPYMKTGTGASSRLADMPVFSFPEKLKVFNTSFSVFIEVDVTIDTYRCVLNQFLVDMGDASNYFKIQITAAGVFKVVNKTFASAENITDGVVVLKGRHRVAVSYDGSTRIMHVSFDGRFPDATEVGATQDFTGLIGGEMCIGLRKSSYDLHSNYATKSLKIITKPTSPAALQAWSAL